MVASVGLNAQSVILANTPATIGVSTSKVSDASAGGALCAGSAYSLQLYAGKDASSLAPVGAVAHFLSGGGAGFFSAGTVILSGLGLNPGDVATVQVWAWGGASANYDAAAGVNAPVGKSNIITVTTGGAGSPPSLPADLKGLLAFSLNTTTIPEPTTIALGLLGVGALMLRRRS